MRNKVCLITGGSRGIGFEVAKELSSSEFKVIICGRSIAQVKHAVLEIDPTGRGVVGYSADIAREKDVKNLVKKIKEKFKRIDVLINAAGIFEPFGTFESIPLKKHAKTIEINLIGAMNICHKVIPLMKKQKFGRIILFSGGGVGGETPLTNASSYFTSKAAIAVFAEVLATELEPFNVTVNAILPGQILTKSTKATFKLTDETLGPVLSKATRELEKTGGGSTQPAINLIKFLISEKTRHISGRLLSARWDDPKILEKSLNPERYKLRRIEGKIYKKVS